MPLSDTPFKRPEAFDQSISLVSNPVVTSTPAERTLPEAGLFRLGAHLGTCHPTPGSVPRLLPRSRRPSQYPGLQTGLVAVNRVWS